MSYPRVTPAVAPKAGQSIPPSETQKIEPAIPSRPLVKRQPFRRTGDDASEHVPQLLLTAEEMLDDKMVRAFWDPQPDPEEPQPYALLDYSTVNRNKPVVVRHTIHEIDRMKEAEEVLKANHGRTWSNALFGTEKERLGVFFSPFQRPMFHAQEKEVYPDHYLDLHFSFSSDFLTHAMLVAKTHHSYNEKGEITLSLPSKKAFFEAFKNIVSKDMDYHCLVLYVKVKTVHSTLPMNMRICLQSKLSKNSSLVARERIHKDQQEKKKQMEEEEEEEDDKKRATHTPASEFPTHTPWSNVCGISSQGGPGFYTIPPRFSGSIDDYVYIADEAAINHPDFTRFIGQNFDKLREEFEQFREDGLFYKMTGEAPGQVIFSSYPFWFFIYYYPIIKVITNRLNPKWIEELHCCHYVHDKKTDKAWVRIPVAAVEEVIRRLEKLFDQDSLLMCFDELSLVISPENGVKGWREYEDWVNNKGNNRGILSGMDNLAQFSVKLELAYEPFKLEAATKPLPNKYLPNAHLAMNASAVPAVSGKVEKANLTPDDVLKYASRLNSGGAVELTQEQIFSIFGKKQ